MICFHLMMNNFVYIYIYIYFTVAFVPNLRTLIFHKWVTKTYFVTNGTKIFTYWVTIIAFCLLLLVFGNAYFCLPRCHFSR